MIEAYPFAGRRGVREPLKADDWRAGTSAAGLNLRFDRTHRRSAFGAFDPMQPLGGISGAASTNCVSWGRTHCGRAGGSAPARCFTGRAMPGVCGG